MTSCGPSILDGITVFALILAAIRTEHFCDRALFGYLEDGSIVRWLQRLKKIDESKQPNGALLCTQLLANCGRAQHFLICRQVGNKRALIRDFIVSHTVFPQLLLNGE
jgi:hypothetical protein